MVRIDNNMDSVSFTISEPEEFYLSYGEGPFLAQLIQIDSEHAVLKINESLSYDGHVVDYLVASPRHEGTSIDDLAAGKDLAVNFVPISGGKDVDLSGDVVLQKTAVWRGRHLIGNLRKNAAVEG